MDHNIKVWKAKCDKLEGKTKKIIKKILKKDKFSVFLTLSDEKFIAVATVVTST